MQPRHSQSRSHSGTVEPGLCALEDYIYLVGESVAMRLLRAQLRRVSPHFRVALITGEEGTGKEVVALALHRLSAESDATFFSQNAASLLTLLPEILTRAQARPSTIIETGKHERVAVAPPAVQPGVFSALVPNKVPDSAKSTLFLTDVGELTYVEQMHLLRSLQRIVSLKNEIARPRIIFATSRDLRTFSATGHFDQNLYRKISAIEIVLPPLRSRPEDIPLITCGLLSRSARSGGMTAAAFDGRALSRLQCHDWPGNVRELEHVVDRAHQHAREGIDGIIEAVHLPPLGEFARAHHRHQLDHRVERLEDVIQGHVMDVLLRCSGNKVRAAERLGISRSTLYRMLDANTQERAS